MLIKLFQMFMSMTKQNAHQDYHILSFLRKKLDDKDSRLVHLDLLAYQARQKGALYWLKMELKLQLWNLKKKIYSNFKKLPPNLRNIY